MLVGVEMGRIATEQLTERGDLTIHLLADGIAVRWDNLIEWDPLAPSEGPLAKIEVQPDAEVWMLTRIGRRLPGRRPPDHGAGGSQDAVLERPDDAAIHPGTLPEVVRVNDQDAAVHQRIPSRSAAETASPTQSWAWSGGGVHSGEAPSSWAALCNRHASRSVRNSSSGAPPA